MNCKRRRCVWDHAVGADILPKDHQRHNRQHHCSSCGLTRESMLQRPDDPWQYLPWRPRYGCDCALSTSQGRQPLQNKWQPYRCGSDSPWHCHTIFLFHHMNQTHVSFMSRLMVDSPLGRHLVPWMSLLADSVPLVQGTLAAPGPPSSFS